MPPTRSPMGPELVAVHNTCSMHMSQRPSYVCHTLYGKEEEEKEKEKEEKFDLCLFLCCLFLFLFLNVTAVLLTTSTLVLSGIVRCKKHVRCEKGCEGMREADCRA